MYKDYFCLREMPFSIAPDPRFLYRSVRHREALAHLLYGVQGEGGIVLLTGEVGTGKTTICRCLLEEIGSSCDVAFILNPRLSAKELLAAICDEFHIVRPAGAARVKSLVDAINAHLLAANAQERRAVLIIDEAQNLKPDVLEQLRLLTNLETNTRKLLQIILIGQPELQEMLSRPELRQVAQRVVARYHLTHLTRAEVAGYVAHRLNVSGARVPIFPDSLIGTLYRVTGGVPRLINLVCDRAMLGASVQGKLQVTPKTLRDAAGEVLATSRSGRPRWRRKAAWPLISAAVLCAGGVFAANLLDVPLWPLDWIVPERPAFVGAPTRQPELVAAPHASSQAAGARAEIAAEANPVSAPELPSAADAAAAQTDHLTWPESTAPRARSEEIAFRDLLRLRGLEYDPGDKRPPCKAVEGLKLRCQHGRGGLADLRRFNQPAVLRIDGGGKGKEFNVVVTGLGENTATVLIAGETRRVALAEFAQLWSGSLVHLWDVPPGYTDVLMSGSRGPAVPWLRQALARLQGGSADGPAVFDDALVRRVKAFQFSEGMVADGAAGALTLISLNMRLNEKLPRLAPVAGER
jgi:general secretion pathway protein A